MYRDPLTGPIVYSAGDVTLTVYLGQFDVRSFKQYYGGRQEIMQTCTADNVTNNN